MMNKSVLQILILFCLLQTTHAAEKYDVKAFRTVLKLCGECHGVPFYLAKQKDEDEWAEYFESDKTLLDLHKDNKMAIENIQSKRFKYFRNRILKFFINNSKYATKVHGCDSNFCGANH